MRSSRLAILVIAAILAGASAFPTLALGRSRSLFEFGDLVGSTPNMTVRSVPSGGAPWVANGSAELGRDGRLEVHVEGLLLTNTGNPLLDGTTGPVRGVRASLACEGTNVVATTGVVPLDASGNAEIEETIALPSSCVGPIVLIRIGATSTNPGPLLGPWIAASGF
jgi:hypothetical protein